MKFEIDLNELTTEQRTHVATFITGWPTYSEVSNRLKEILDAPENEEFKIAKRAGGIAGARNLSEEQRLDAEQKEELSAADECRKIGSQSNDKIRRFTSVLSEEQRLDAEQKEDLGPIGDANLNAIFGTPDVAKGAPPLIPGIPYHTVPLDKEGIPWDSRIHASTKTLIADGSWKLRRGVDSAEVEKVKAQLKELMAVPVVTGMDLAAGSDVTAIAPAPVVTIGSASTVPVPPAPKSHYLIDQPPVDVPVPGIPSPAPVTLTDLIGRMSKAIAENRLTQANVTEMCVKHGVSEFFLLGNRPDLFPLIDADMKAMGV